MSADLDEYRRNCAIARAVYRRIMREAERGRGVRLSPDEVWALHLDSAVADGADPDGDAYEEREVSNG